MSKRGGTERTTGSGAPGSDGRHAGSAHEVQLGTHPESGKRPRIGHPHSGLIRVRRGHARWSLRSARLPRECEPIHPRARYPTAGPRWMVAGSRSLLSAVDGPPLEQPSAAGARRAISHSGHSASYHLERCQRSGRPRPAPSHRALSDSHLRLAGGGHLSVARVGVARLARGRPPFDPIIDLGAPVLRGRAKARSGNMAR